jgi:hypothetical protein
MDQAAPAKGKVHALPNFAKLHIGHALPNFAKLHIGHALPNNLSHTQQGKYGPGHT